MRSLSILILGIFCGAAVVVLFRNGQTDQNQKILNQLADVERDILNHASEIAASDSRPVSPETRSFPELRGRPTPRATKSLASEVFGEFVDELGLSNAEKDAFFSALSDSEQKLVEFAHVDEATGIPVLPTKEAIAAHRANTEAAISEVIGMEGLQKFKAYTSTLLPRAVIRDLERKGVVTPLTSAQKQELLYGAYNQTAHGDKATTPIEHGEAITEAILVRSAEIFHPDDQKIFTEAMAAELDKMSQRMGGGFGQRSQGF